MNCVHDLITLLNATFSRNLSQALLRSADVDSTHFSLALALASETSFINFLIVNGGINIEVPFVCKPKRLVHFDATGRIIYLTFIFPIFQVNQFTIIT